jgi:hypothetical protein
MKTNNTNFIVGATFSVVFFLTWGYITYVGFSEGITNLIKLFQELVK